MKVGRKLNKSLVSDFSESGDFALKNPFGYNTYMQQSSSEHTSFHQPLTKEDIHADINARVSRIDHEFREAFEFIQDYPKSVTFFGSSRSTEDNDHYQKARSLAGKIVKELGYAVLTGGSAGIMEAANRGAFEAGGQSVGLNIKLPKEQFPNKYTTASVDFSFFFVRKVALSFAAEAYLFFPGGFGTLDELFEILTLVQTHKIRRVPVFLIGKDFWDPFHEIIKENLLALHRTINPSDLDLYTVTDNDDEIISRIRSVPIHDGKPKHHLFRKD